MLSYLRVYDGTCDWQGESDEKGFEAGVLFER